MPENRNFLTLWAATTISQFGTMLGALMLTALLYLDASPAQMGLLTAAMSAPVLLLALIAGVWVDRLPRRRVMIVADFGRFALLMSVPVAALAGRLHIEHLYVVAFAVGSLDVAFRLAYRSVLPQIAPPEQLIEANSKLEMSDAAARSISPALGGGIVQAAGGPAAVMVDGLSFLLSGIVVSRIKAPERERAEAERSALREALDGIRAVVGQPVLRAIFGMVTSYSFFGGFFLTVYGIWVLRELDLSALALGILTGAGGAGSLIGASIAGRLSRRLGIGPAMISSYYLAAALTLLIPLSAELPEAAFGLLLFEALAGDSLWIIHNVNEISLRQSITPEPQLGRVNATMLLANSGLRPAGALAAGLVATALGLQETLLIAVAGINLAGLWLVFSPLRQVKSATAIPPLEA
jgi:predicted MFS family arabinose efflux permease